MTSATRRDRLLSAVRAGSQVSLRAFASREGVSEMTVRRDAAELERRGLVERFHGGVRVPSSNAPTAARASAITVGLVVPDPNYYFPEIVAGATSRAASRNVKVRLGVSRYAAETELRQVEALLRSHVDALIIAPTQPDDRSLADMLERADVPTVILERSIDACNPLARFDSIRSDHVGGTLSAMHLLRAAGHTHIAVLASASQTADQVLRGYQMTDVPAEVPAPLVAPAGPLSAADISAWIDRALEGGATAFIAHSDRLAFELIDQLTGRDLAVPDDVSVIAYDDEYVGMAPQPITAVAPAKHLLGSMAVDFICTQVEGRRETLHVTVAPILNERSTVGTRNGKN